MRIVIVCALLTGGALAQNALQQQVRTIAAAAHGKVAVACSLPNSGLNCDLDAHARPPMQSVFKLPLTIYALHLVERRQLTLDQPIRFLKSDRFLPPVYSPLQEKYPDADVSVPLRELLRLASSLSDNVAADIVLRIVGGPEAVDGYIKSLGVNGFHLVDSEHGLHADITAQYRNWFEPAGAVQLLRRLSDNSPLNSEHTQLLFDWLRDSPTGAHRIKGSLPAGTVVVHKTGTSDTRDGLTYATNDIGLIFLPDGRRLAIALFVTDAKADEATRDAVIAHIAKASYEAAMQN